MKHLKTFLCTTLAVCSLSIPCAAGVVESSVTEPCAGGSGTEITPLASHIALDTEINKKSKTWYQLDDYTSYRVWIDNTTNERMTVTITSPSSSDYHQYTVPANSGKTYTVNDAVSGVHTITFATPSGDLSGTLRVRVSDVAL